MGQIFEQRWVPLWERKPEVEEMCLVTCRTQKGILSVNRAYMDERGSWHGSGSMSEVVAWTKLPPAFDPEPSHNQSHYSFIV